MAGRVLEVGVVASDGVERFENVACKEAFGVFGGFVSHESVDEGPSGGLSCNTAEGCVEKVGIVGDRLLKAGSAVVGEYLKVDAIAVLLTKFIQSGKLRDLNQIVVTAVSGLTLGTYTENMQASEASYYSNRSPRVGDTSPSYLLWEPERPCGSPNRPATVRPATGPPIE